MNPQFNQPKGSTSWNINHKAVARAANVAESAVIFSSETTVNLDNKTVIYDETAQKIWGKPSGIPNGAKIISVSGSELTYTGPVTVKMLEGPTITFRSELADDYGMALIGSFPSVAALKDFSGIQSLSTGDRVVVRSFLDGYDIGGGVFQWHGSSTTPDDAFSVIKPNSVSGSGRWVNIKRGRLIPEECGCVPNDPAFDNGVALNRWASQDYCIGSPLDYYSSDTVTLSGTGSTINVNGNGMKVIITTSNKNGVTCPASMSKSIKIKKMISHAADGVISTLSHNSNGFYFPGLRLLKLQSCEAQGWMNSGAMWMNVIRYEIDDFFGWRNDWDGSTTFSSGADLVEWTGTPGNSKSGRITNNTCLSDASQSISVNSLSASRNVIISGNHCMTYSNTEFTPKAKADIKKRHAITIGYVSHQDYGGGIEVDNNILRDTGWTGIYRSGGSDGTVAYLPCMITNNQIYDVGLNINQDNIGAGILLGDIVDGDIVSGNLVSGFGGTNNAAYKIQDSQGTGKITLSDNVDINSLGYGIQMTGQVVDVLIKGHRSINPAKPNIFITPQASAANFGRITIEGGKLERNTDGYAIQIANGITAPVNIKNVEMRGTTNNVTTNASILITSQGELVNVRRNQIYGFGYGIWYGTYVNTDSTFPWGGNEFFGTVNAHRISRSTGTAVAKVQPNFYSSVTNRFSNGANGTSNGTEEFLVNGVPVT
ncbi:putative head binding protein [Shigella phage ChubbyThor]|nr:putative head binding protein [Shigella phage ChubbyThor]